MDSALAESPNYVVLNRVVGSLMNKNALQAAIGETVRLNVAMPAQP